MLSKMKTRMRMVDWYKDRNQICNQRISRKLTMKMLRMVNNAIITIIIKILTLHRGTPWWQSSHPVKTSTQEERRKQTNLKSHHCHHRHCHFIIKHQIIQGVFYTGPPPKSSKYKKVNLD